MNDREIIDEMKGKVEQIIREKSQLTGNSKQNDSSEKREIVKEILKELDKVVDYEN